MLSITNVEMLIAWVFAEVYDIRMGWYPEVEILRSAGCHGVKPSTVKAARKNLGIEKIKINGITYWRWSSDEDPDQVWEVKSNES